MQSISFLFRRLNYIPSLKHMHPFPNGMLHTPLKLSIHNTLRPCHDTLYISLFYLVHFSIFITWGHIITLENIHRSCSTVVHFHLDQFQLSHSSLQVCRSFRPLPSLSFFLLFGKSIHCFRVGASLRSQHLVISTLTLTQFLCCASEIERETQVNSILVSKMLIVAACKSFQKGYKIEQNQKTWVLSASSSFWFICRGYEEVFPTLSVCREHLGVDDKGPVQALSPPPLLYAVYEIYLDILKSQQKFFCNAMAGLRLSWIIIMWT